ncbi:hypothetical protein U9M48_030408 [Paspalum notatum var. saurae]|uniref:3-ketoacyl-CoA synthase n=1 Tax=Paspalum notatum var. saurae TaxID=547442 RepID=A0AAQ3U4U1_PASNO
MSSPSPLLSNNKGLIKAVYRGVVDNFLAVVTVPLAAAALVAAARSGPPDQLAGRLLAEARPVHLFLGAFLPAAAATVYLLLRPRAVYLVDYACFRTAPNCRVPFSTFLEHAKQRPVHDQTAGAVGARRGDVPPPAHHYIPTYEHCTLDAARGEVELVVFSALDDLFAKTRVSPAAVDIVVVNCSLFCPTPSFVDMVVNRYGMRADVRAVHLAGMGCSAGLVAVGLARSLLQVAPRGTRALVVSTETITPNYYVGSERAMLLPNCLFRIGGAAALLPNSPAAGARFRLRHVVRTLTGAQDDSAYTCVFQEEDGRGNVGINLSKDLMAIAGNALKANITAMGPLVLPASEQLHFALSFVARKMFISLGIGRFSPKPYIPDFRTAFDHFCIHAGGRAVIDELQRSLKLSDEQVEASRMTLHRFGNTSSSSLWYELAYIEAKSRMRRGDRVWMIGFGSGFKCNSAAWECIEPAANADGPWATSIHRYPVDIPDVLKH